MNETDRREDASHQRSWPQLDEEVARLAAELLWSGVMWITTNAIVAFGDERWRVAGFVTSSVMVVLVLGWLYATQRLADSQRQLIAAYEDEARIAKECIEALKQEAYAAKCVASSYRRAFTYAKKVGEGMDKKQAGIEAGRPQDGAA